MPPTNANTWMLARYDMQNPAAIKRLVAGGAQLRPFPDEVLDACLTATNEAMGGDLGEATPTSRRSIDAMQAYPVGPVSVVAGRRIHQRHLHDPLAHPRLRPLTRSGAMRLKAQPSGRAFFALPASISVYVAPKSMQDQAPGKRGVREIVQENSSMKRRDFIKSAGLAWQAPPSLHRRSPSRCRRLKWRLTSSFPKSLDTIYGAAEVFAKAVAEATDNKFQIQVFAAGEIVPGAAGRRRGAATAPSRCATPRRTTISARTRPSRSAPRCRSASTAACRTPGCIGGGGMELMNEFYKKYNIYRASRRQYRLPDGRLVPQGDQGRRRPEGPEDAHRRLRRPGAGQARRRAAADRRRRHLSGAGEGHDRRGRVGRPLRRREARLQQGRQYYYYPGWWEGGADAPQLHQHSTSGTRCRRPTSRSSRPRRHSPTN